VDAVTLLRRRHRDGPRRPVLRHEELWFKGGVTHNRVASHLRARLLNPDAIFSSESPCYVVTAPWLDSLSLLALLNAPILEFALKTFLGTRNHVELGHVCRLPVPILTSDELSELGSLAQRAIAATQSAEPVDALQRDLDQLTRDLYKLSRRVSLSVVR
jgi:hypothetical protein